MADLGHISSVIKVAKAALMQDEYTPENERLSLRTLLAEAVPLLEEFRLAEEKAARERNEGWRRRQFQAKQAAKRKYGWA